jgi:hypothetical protein
MVTSKTARPKAPKAISVRRHAGKSTSTRLSITTNSNPTKRLYRPLLGM